MKPCAQQILDPPILVHAKIAKNDNYYYASRTESTSHTERKLISKDSAIDIGKTMNSEIVLEIMGNSQNYK